MLPVPAGAFDAYVASDALRAALAVAGVLFVLLCFKVVYLRIRRDDPPSWPLAFAWAALAVGCFIVTAVSVDDLGTPTDWTCPARGVFLALGYTSLSKDLGWLPGWRKRYERAQQRIRQG